MILDSIKYRAFYSRDPNLKAILDYMATVTPASLPAQTQNLVADKAFVNPVSFVTKPEIECLFEAHRKYADIHYIIEGCEKIVVANIENVTVVTPHNESKDIGFYRGDMGTTCILKPGDFLICYPQDAHKVAIMVDASAPVKKLVGKLQIEVD